MRSNRVRPFELLTVLTVTIACLLYTSQVPAAITAKLTPAEDGIELESTGEGGSAVKETIPVYHAGTIRYFSTGIGLEERSAQYPPFTLKVVFVTGPRAYLSHVSVTITDERGKTLLDIPGEKVTGPWLFVDLPPGTYTISGAGPGGARVHDRVTVTSGQVKTVYLRWKGEGTAQ
jgi:hypothetical protein